ncbi:PKD domain-containing protein, partial [Pedobacter sp. ASV28]|uniref:PKD domain-containing protein n=1 Tax=Pedobacter sp. ASV28 TaxID=2795123 RepID=UPI0018ECF027
LYNYSLPSTKFANTGNYILKAIIHKPVSADCAIDEEIFTTFDIFSPNFTLPNEACVNTPVEFKDASPTTGGTIKSWRWDFGDGTYSTLQNPKHVFKTTGIKNITLNVITDIGCNLSITRTMQVIAAPKSMFTAVGPFCVNSTIKFNNESTFTNSNIASQVWDFGNGQTNLTEKSPSSAYTTAGVFNVRLISISSLGCADTLTKAITIYALPEISFNDPGSCVSDAVKFEATAVKGNITSWLWDFGDGSNDLTQNTKQISTHKYSQTGVYTVKLTGISTEGCSTTFSRQITISGSNPAVLFEVKDAQKLCANLDVSFENKSTIAFGKITRIDWIFDYKEGGTNTIVTDNNPLLGKIYTHKYPNAATKIDYEVVMIAYSGQVCYTQSTPVTVTVYPAPILTFNTIQQVCEDANPFQLVASEDNHVSGMYTFSGTGVSSTGIFSPRVSGPGNFAIKYKFSSPNSCTEEKTITIVVNKLPKITMGADIDILLGGEKRIDATVIGTNLKFKWSPSEGLSSDSVLDPIAKPTKTTRYVLTVSAESCSIVSEVTVTVHENPVIPNVFSPNGDQKNDTWNIKYLETFAEGNISIFNRYGQKVFYASPYTTPWDGKLNGTDLPVGVYYYIIEPNNGRKKYTGSVTILR